MWLYYQDLNLLNEIFINYTTFTHIIRNTDLSLHSSYYLFINIAIRNLPVLFCFGKRTIPNIFDSDSRYTHIHTAHQIYTHIYIVST